MDRIRIPRRFNVGDCVSVLGGTVAGRVLDGAQCPVGHESLETGRKRLVGSGHAPRTCSRLNGEGGGCAAVYAKPSGAGPARPGRAHQGPAFPLRASPTSRPCPAVMVCVSPQRSSPTGRRGSAGFTLDHRVGTRPGPRKLRNKLPSLKDQESGAAATPRHPRHSSGGPRPVRPMRTRSAARIRGVQGWACPVEKPNRPA